MYNIIEGVTMSIVGRRGRYEHAQWGAGRESVIKLRNSLKPMVLGPEEIERILDLVRKDELVVLEDNPRIRDKKFQKLKYAKVIGTVQRLLIMEQLTKRFTEGNDFEPRIAALYPSLQCVIEGKHEYHIITTPPSGSTLTFMFGDLDEDSWNDETRQKMKMVLNSAMDMIAIMNLIAPFLLKSISPSDIIFNETSRCCSFVGYGRTPSITDGMPVGMDVTVFMKDIKSVRPDVDFEEEKYVPMIKICSWLRDHTPQLERDGITKEMANIIAAANMPNTYPEFAKIQSLPQTPQTPQTHQTPPTPIKRTRWFAYNLLVSKAIRSDYPVVHYIPEDHDKEPGPLITEEMVKNVDGIIKWSMNP